MSTATVESLIETLRQLRLLDSKQLDELAAQQFSDPQALAHSLTPKGWLTTFQANALLQGKGENLVLGQYVILDRIGEGGMGQVFKAWHRGLGRIAAIKVIHKERLDNPDAVRRFQREVRAAAALNHPNVVVAYDADEIGGRHLLVMEYVEGATDLSQLVKKNGPLPVTQACEYIRQAALGLQHAFEKGLVHRDIKPHNLLLTADGKTVKILDMGLARIQHGDADDKSSTTLTQEGSVMGTPDYISPEQAEDSHTVDIRADIYSLGCTFYYLLAGRVPFPSGSMAEKLLKHVLDDPQPIEELRPDVFPGVAEVVKKMMAKKPEDRYQTPAEVAGVLASWAGLDVSSTQVASQQPRRLQPVPRDDADTAWPSLVTPAPVVAERQVPADLSRRPSWLWPGVVSGVFLVVGVVVVTYLAWKNVPPTSKESKSVEQDRPVATDNRVEEIDLLALIDPKKHAIKGEWKLDGKTLLSPKDKEARILIPFTPPGEYELDLVFTRMDGPEGIHIGLVAGNYQVMAVLDGWGTESGLHLLDGRMVNSNETTIRGSVLNGSGTPITVTYLVQNNKILVRLGGKTVINWHGASKRLGMQAEWAVPERTNLFIGSSQSIHRISKLTLKSLPASEKAFNRWLTSTQKLSPEKQVEAVSQKLIDLNPGFDGKVTHKIENGVITELQFLTDDVADIMPLRALNKLKTLNCSGNRSKGILADLSPLKGMMSLTELTCSHTKVQDLTPLKGLRLENLNLYLCPISDLTPLAGMPLTSLNVRGVRSLTDLSPLKDSRLTYLTCHATQVSDLSPLEGLPLAVLDCSSTKVQILSPLKSIPLKELTCDFKPSRDAELVRSIKTLEKINGKPALTFWKEAEAQQAAFEAWCKEVAAMRAEKQVEAVAAKLKELNPGFDGKVTPGIRNGVVTDLEFLTDNVMDISPVRGLAGLTSLKCTASTPGKARLTDLSPLKGLSLARLNCGWTRVSDLTPLKAMPLMALRFDGTQVTDLAPLKGIELASIDCRGTKVTDLGPLRTIAIKDFWCDFKSARDSEILRSIKTLETINGKPAKEFWEEVDNPKTVDLLKLIKPEKHAAKGKWHFDGEALVSDTTAFASLQIPYTPGDDYVLRIVAERKRGNDSLVVGMIVARTGVMAVMDGWRTHISGLERIDGKESDNNETTTTYEFRNNTPTEIVCSVRGNTIVVTVDGRKIIDWKGQASRLSAREEALRQAELGFKDYLHELWGDLELEAHPGQLADLVGALLQANDLSADEQVDALLKCEKLTVPMASHLADQAEEEHADVTLATTRRGVSDRQKAVMERRLADLEAKLDVLAKHLRPYEERKEQAAAKYREKLAQLEEVRRAMKAGSNRMKGAAVAHLFSRIVVTFDQTRKRGGWLPGETEFHLWCVDELVRHGLTDQLSDVEQQFLRDGETDVRKLIQSDSLEWSANDEPQKNQGKCSDSSGATAGRRRSCS